MYASMASHERGGGWLSSTACTWAGERGLISQGEPGTWCVGPPPFLFGHMPLGNAYDGVGLVAAQREDQREGRAAGAGCGACAATGRGGARRRGGASRHHIDAPLAAAARC